MWYGLQEEHALLGAIVLRRYTVSKAGRDIKREHAFKITKGGAKSYWFAADTHDEMERYFLYNTLFVAVVSNGKCAHVSVGLNTSPKLQL